MSVWVSFADIKRQVGLAEVLHSYGVDWLRRSGPQQYRGRCPLHRGQGTEAFHANLERNVFHCFACGAGGNVLDFVARMEGCPVREAAVRLQASQFGGDTARVPSSGPGRGELVTKKRGTNPPLGFSLEVDGNHPYLASRAIDPITAGHFGVGYYGGRGVMSGRIAIPIHDHQGHLVAYCGRALDDGGPRYRFPVGFQKSQVLFNYHRARTMEEDPRDRRRGFLRLSARSPGRLSLGGGADGRPTFSSAEETLVRPIRPRCAVARWRSNRPGRRGADRTRSGASVPGEKSPATTRNATGPNGSCRHQTGPRRKEAKDPREPSDMIFSAPSAGQTINQIAAEKRLHKILDKPVLAGKTTGFTASSAPRRLGDELSSSVSESPFPRATKNQSFTGLS